MQFKIIVQSLDGTKKWEVPITTWSFTEELNKDRSATFEIDEQVVQAIGDAYGQSVQFIFFSEYREIYIYDDSDTLIYGGYIAEVQTYNDANGYKKRTITSKGFFSLLEKRLTNIPPDLSRIYTSDHASDIAWDLIDYTQGLDYGDLGITRGADPADVNNDRTYRYRPIKEAIEKLGNNETKDGIDFEITAGKVFNAYYPTKGSERDEILLEEGFNIRTYEIAHRFIDAMVNEVVVFGDGDGDNMITSLRSSTATIKSTFFLLQGGLSEKDTKIVANLENKGDKYLELKQSPSFALVITTDYDQPDYTKYSLGDSLKVVIPTESINDFYRVRRRTVNNNGDVTLSFSSV